MKISDKLPKYVAALFSFGTFIGIIYNYIFYSIFNVNYFAFSDLSEILSSFLPSTALLVVFLVGPIGYMSGLITAGYAIENNKKPPAFLAKRYVANIILYIIGIIVALLLFANLFINSPLYLTFIGTTILSAIVSTFTIIQKWKYNFIPYYKLFIGNVVFITLVVTLILPKIEIRYFILGSHPTQIEIVFKDSTVLKSDSVHFYVNQTKNYLFMYNKSTKITSIFKTEDIKRYEIKSRSYLSGDL